MSLPERIIRARIDAGYKVAASFADQIAVRPNTLWRYERGMLKPSIDALARIARCTGKPMDWFMDDSEAA